MVTHFHLIHSMIHDVRVWMDFWRATHDPRALVMAQVAYLAAQTDPLGHRRGDQAGMEETARPAAPGNVPIRQIGLEDEP